MAPTYTGAAQVQASDYRYIKWVGKTKGGQSIQIELPKAFCRSNPDWAFAEKNETTPEVEFEGVYTDEQLATDDRTEPWELTLPEGLKAGNDEILLGVRKLHIGPMEGRISKDSGRPKLKLTALQWLTKVSQLYACVTTKA